MIRHSLRRPVELYDLADIAETFTRKP
jgi:hypothetical protein